MVENIGNFDDTLDVSSSLTLTMAGNDTNIDWLIGDGNSGTLDVNQSDTIELALTIPELAWNGTIASVELELSSDGLLLQTFTVDVEVISQPLWIIRATGSDLDVAPGGSNITLELEQRGNSPSRAYLSASIDAVGWNLTLPDDMPFLDPGETVAVQVYIVPPQGAISGPTAEMTIIARNGDGSGTGETILPLRIRPAYDFTVTTPNDWEGWQVSDSGGMPRITIANLGNAANQLHVELIGLPSGWAPTEANISLAWSEMKGVPIDLIPDSSWDHSNFTIEVKVTDLGGKIVTLNAEVLFSDVAWATSPVMWGSIGDDKIVNFHGSLINSVTTGSTSLEQIQSGWLLPSPSGDGSLVVSNSQGDVSLFYTAHMQMTTSRQISCTMDSNLSAQPLISCDIYNGSSPFTWSILLRAEDGTLINSRNGVVEADKEETVNLSATGWNPTTGIHELTVLVFSSDGRLQSSESQHYVVRATGWNVGIELEEASSGNINVLIQRENHQIMTDSICIVKLVQGDWSMEVSVDISATLAPKLSVPRPTGDSTVPVNATFSCQAPWDVDDDPSDNTHDLVLSSQPNIIPVSSDTVYAIGTGLLIIAVLWLLGVIRPASLQPLTTTPRKPAKKVKQQARPKPQPKPAVVEKESSIQLEDESPPTVAEEDTDVTEIQESLIEIEEAPPEPPEEELDEFELRLKQLRERRR